MSTPVDIPFQQLLNALLDADTPLPARFFYRLSDLEQDDLTSLAIVWPDVPVWRRQALMEDVEELGERDTLLSFLSLACFTVQDEDPRVRLLAVRTLWEYEEVKLIPIFLNLLKTDSDDEVRAAAAGALGRFVYAGELDQIPTKTSREIEDTLLRITNSSDAPLVRRAALESLGYSGREEVLSLIEAAYTSGDKYWMASALFAMGRSANERWHAQVLAMLQSNLPTLRKEAARAAGELEIKEARPLLIELLDDPDDTTRLASIWSLSQIGGEGVRDTLEDIYQETYDERDIDFLEAALDNLAFTEDLPLMPLFDFPNGEWEGESNGKDYDLLNDAEDLSN